MTSENVIDSTAWEKGVSRLAGELDPQIFTAYIKPLRFLSYDSQNAAVELIAPSAFVRNQVDQNFREKIMRALSGEMRGPLTTLKLSVDRSAEMQRPALVPHVVVKKIRPMACGKHSAEAESASSAIAFTASSSGLNTRYTFANFVVGSSNQFCHAAALRVAEHPGTSYNPLFIYGGVGLGKTHLLHAIGNAVLARDPAAKVVYMSSESFTNELIQSLRLAKMDEFKTRMRSIEILLIDDIQFMCGKERTQEEFFHTFNSLYNAKHQIVITSDKIPQDIPGIEERLQTRFSWGLTADLQAPDFETRVAILRRKAAQESCNLPEDVAHFVAEKISSNIRELEGALTRLHALSSLQRVAIDLKLAESALRHLLQPKTVNLSINDIKKAVADHFSLKVSDMVSKRRTKNLSFPRHVAMYLCRKHTTASYPEIGSQFGGRDHSSVIHAANVVSAKITSDNKVKDLITQLEKKLLSF